jgi:hypothetical protein
MGFNDLNELFASFGGDFMKINVSNGAMSIIGNSLGPYSALTVSGGGVSIPHKRGAAARRWAFRRIRAARDEPSGLAHTPGRVLSYLTPASA